MELAERGGSLDYLLAELSESKPDTLQKLLQELHTETQRQCNKRFEEMEEKHAVQLAALRIEFQLQHKEKSSVGNMSSTTFIFWLFLAGTVLTTCFALVQVIILFTNNKDTASSTAFFIVNILCISWTVFGYGISLCHAPSMTLLRLDFILLATGCVFEAVWAEYVFGLIAMFFFVVCGFMAVFLIFASSKLYQLVTILPLSDTSWEVWFACFRLFVIGTTPILARFVQNGTASQVSFFAVVLFCLTMMMFCISCRVIFAIYVAKSFAALFMKVRLFPLILHFGPTFGILIVFAVLYIIEVSGSSLFIADGVVISLLVTALALLSVWTCVGLSMVTRWKIIAPFYPFNSEETSLFAMAQRKGLEQQLESFVI